MSLNQSAAAAGTQEDLQALLIEVGIGDREAFARLYDATVPRVYGLVRRVVEADAVAEDVVAEVYLQVWRKAADFDPARGSALTWLLMLARSRALDQLRRSHVRDDPLVSDQDEFDEPVAPATAEPEDILHAVEEGSAVHRALEALDAPSRQLVALAFFRGLSHSELAKLTGVPLGTVKTRLRRATQLMRTHLEDEGIH